MANTNPKCTTTTTKTKESALVTQVQCSTGSATYTADPHFPTLVLRDNQAREVMVAGVVSGMRDITTEPSLKERMEGHPTLSISTDPLVKCGEGWFHDVAVSPNVYRQVLVDKLQSYAQTHADVVEALRSINPTLSSGTPATLNEVLDAPPPQFRACPEGKPNVIVERK